jgi:hypothetical protein
MAVERETAAGDDPLHPGVAQESQHHHRAEHVAVVHLRERRSTSPRPIVLGDERVERQRPCR